MGIFDCDLHGYQGFREVCEHVGAALRSGVLLHRTRVLDVEVCDVCVVRHDLTRFLDETFSDWDEDAHAHYHVLNTTSECHCVECIATVKLSSARARGEPDPFPPYERTLTFLQKDVIDRLEAGLKDAFPFRQSIVRPPWSSLSVRRGAITYPLEVIIYYVTERSDQDAILQWIERFFDDIPQRQRRVLFYRAESWQEIPVLPPDTGRHFSRGPEELLRREETDPPIRSESITR